MPKYNVGICITDYFNVTVEADEESEARDMAVGMMAGMEERELVTCFSHSDGFDSCGCELIEPDKETT